MEDILKQGLGSLGLDTAAVPQLTEFARRLLEKNKVMNLTAITEPRDVATLHLLDSATLGGIYSTGSFSLLASTEPDTLRFRFIGDTDWSVQVLPEAGFRVPLWSEPAGVSRPLGFSRHFIVRGQPQPERR